MHERLRLAKCCVDSIARCLDLAEMTDADGREIGPLRALHVHDPPRCRVALEGAGCLLFDLRPGRLGDGGELAMEIIHVLLFFGEPTLSEPSDEDDRDAASDGANGNFAAMFSNNAAGGTKNGVPVTARL